MVDAGFQSLLTYLMIRHPPHLPCSVPGISGIKCQCNIEGGGKSVRDGRRTSLLPQVLPLLVLSDFPDQLRGGEVHVFHVEGPGGLLLVMQYVLLVGSSPPLFVETPPHALSRGSQSACIELVREASTLIIQEYTPTYVLRISQSSSKFLTFSPSCCDEPNYMPSVTPSNAT